MRTNPAGKGETFEECPEAVFVLASIWVDLRVGTLEVRVRERQLGRRDRDPKYRARSDRIS